MKEKLRPYLIPALLLFLQIVLSLFFAATHRIPGPKIVTEWPNGVSTGTIPLWSAAVAMPALSLFLVAAMFLNTRIPGPVWWRTEDWRLRGSFGPLTNAFLFIATIIHLLGLMNVSSHWTLNQGLIQSVAGLTLGVMMIAVGNYQTKTSSVGLWALTPWKMTDPQVKQQCQQIAGRVALLGGTLIVLLNVLLVNTPPLAGTIPPIYPQMPLTMGLTFGIYLLVAVLTWKPSRQKKLEKQASP
ncbi:MAG TPA: hypothetical protein V6C82_06020 [Chroococcales cyanobacterium]|jgi:hypothetical protein